MSKMKEPTTAEFEAWVKANFIGQRLDDPPADWDQEKEFFYLMDGLQYRITNAAFRGKFGDI